MKNYLLFFIALSMGAQVLSQNLGAPKFDYKVFYELKYQPDSLDESSVKNETMVLFLGNNYSKFSSIGQHIKDSVFQTYNNKARTMDNYAEYKSKIPVIDHKYIVIKNSKSDEMYFLEKIGKDNLGYKETIENFKWQIKDEFKTVSGYRTQKAITYFKGREFVAWFSEEIPIPNGPYKFGGLPGLIIQLNDTKEHYVFNLISFNKLKPSVKSDVILDNFLLTDKKKFDQLKQDYKQNPLANFERSGASISFTPAQREMFIKENRKQMEKDNNPLELE